MGEGSLPFIALDFLLQEGEFNVSLVLPSPCTASFQALSVNAFL